MSEDLRTYLKQFTEVTEWLEKELALPNGFIVALPEEDDWSFIIKTHALIEAAVTNQLSASIDPRLISVFERLELSDDRQGKIAFIKALDLLNSDQRKFIRFLSELRNELVHNVRSISFSIEAHFSNSDPNQRNKFLDAVTYFSTHSESYRSQAAGKPKLAIWAAALMMLLDSTHGANSEKRERESLLTRSKMLDRVLEAFKASQS